MLRRAFLSVVAAIVPAWSIRTTEATATEFPVAVEPKKRVGYLWSEIPKQYQRNGVWFAKHKSDDDLKIQPVMLTESMPDEASCLWKIERCKRADLEFLMRVDALNNGWNVGPQGWVKEPSSRWLPSAGGVKYVLALSKDYMLLEIHQVTENNPLPSIDETAFLDWYDDYASARRHASKELLDRVPKADPLEFMKLVDLTIEHGLQFDNQVFAEAVALRQEYLCKA